MIGLEGVVIEQGEFRLEVPSAVFREGLCTVLIGPSGEGKTTLLQTIAGFVPHRGRLTISGRDMAGVGPADRPVSLLFQDNNLFPHMSVFENVALGVRSDLRLGEADRRSVAAVLERVGLGAQRDARPRSLSGGQAGRAALARALLRARPILLLDEPFAALGPGQRREMARLVREVMEERGLTVLLVSHQPQEARGLAQEASVVAGGRVAAPVDLEALLREPDPALRAYLGRPESPSDLPDPSDPTV